MKDTLTAVNDTISAVAQNGSEQVTLNHIETTNWWFIIAIVEFIIILLLLLRLAKVRKEKLLFEQGFDPLMKAKSKDIDMDNLINSISSSKALYTELSRKCHPDRFLDTQQKKIADELFQEISENKRNHAKLLELKERAIKYLNINF